MPDEARRRGFLALTGKCYETAGTPPFIPFVEMLEHSARLVPSSAFRHVLGEAAPEVAKLMPELRRMFPDIPPPIELPPERRYLFNSFLEFVERGCRMMPQALLMDDLHWADEPTLLLLQPRTSIGICDSRCATKAYATHEDALQVFASRKAALPLARSSGDLTSVSRVKLLIARTFGD